MSLSKACLEEGCIKLAELTFFVMFQCAPVQPQMSMSGSENKFEQNSLYNNPLMKSFADLTLKSFDETIKIMKPCWEYVVIVVTHFTNIKL